jgi:hypothetical protein
MQTRVKMLKVKIKSLTLEARIIRLEERRSKPGSQQQGELHAHRVCDVRFERRCSLLAYAFIRGVALSRCEGRSESPPDWTRVSKLVEKFGVVDCSKRGAQHASFADWKAGREVAPTVERQRSA